MFGAPGAPVVQQGPEASAVPVSGMLAKATAPSGRYTGTVAAYYKFQGYGFITLDQKDVVDNDKCFVYWKNLKSDDRYPTLARGLQVEFGVSEDTKRGKKVFAATDVSLPGGGTISLQKEADSQKTFVGSQEVRYTGKLKFFIPKRGYGYILIDDGMRPDGEEVPTEIRVEVAEINAGGGQPNYMKDVPVEFGIWKTRRGICKAYNVTQPGGVPFSTS
mmetsp:Transcript_49443/g.92518  ORF Transcript_49443/g.92518 Transcript_49443/m.92518 type:complete len:218 (-) Transcript_49443:137-790(-)